MNKLFISIIALAALSGAALASDRFNGERDTSAYVGFYSPKDNMQSPAVTKVSPLAIEDNARRIDRLRAHEQDLARKRKQQPLAVQ